MVITKSKGNMYDFVTHTWNPIKGKCYHDCSYCYMKRWGEQKPVRLDEKELKTNLGPGNFIFVGSSCDMFAENIPDEWILSTLRKCYDHPTNQYLFQTKNPERILNFNHFVFRQSVICTTIESDIWYPDIMKNSPSPHSRAAAMNKISKAVSTYVTIEPILDFNMEEMLELIKRCNPVQVNIGADSGKNNLPEPSPDKIKQLICRLELFTKVKLKSNLRRLIGGGK